MHARSERAASVVRMDAQVAALGPRGLDQLLLDLAAYRSQMTQLEALRDGLQSEVKGSEAARCV